jgi:DeoR family transcriptional regulator of aga operon
MLSEERRREILKLLEEQGRVTVSSLTDNFHISAVTIRSDLDELEAKELLVRSHGGAILPLSPQQEYPPQLKKTIHHLEKVRIGRAAARLVQPRQRSVACSVVYPGRLRARRRSAGWAICMPTTFSLA